MTDPATYITGRTVQEQMNQLIGYVDTRSAEVATDAIAGDMATLSQAVTDAQNAKDDAEAARDTAISTVSDCVKKTPAAAQTITGYPLTVDNDLTVNGTGDIPVPTGTTGTYDLKATNSTRIKNELDAYAPMVRITNNQTIAGTKTFTSTMIHSQSGNNYGFVDQRTDVQINSLVGTMYKNVLKVTDADDYNLAVLEVRGYTNGTTAVFLKVRNSDGTTKSVTLAAGDVI